MYVCNRNYNSNTLSLNPVFGIVGRGVWPISVETVSRPWHNNSISRISWLWDDLTPSAPPEVSSLNRSNKLWSKLWYCYTKHYSDNTVHRRTIHLKENSAEVKTSSLFITDINGFKCLTDIPSTVIHPFYARIRLNNGKIRNLFKMFGEMKSPSKFGRL